MAERMDPWPILRELAPTRRRARLTSCGSGWEHRVWTVDDDLVLRVNPAQDETVRTRSVQRDLRLLELVGAHLSVAVGEAVAAAPALGAMLMRRVPGRAVADGGRMGPVFAADLARLLTELRAVPAVPAAQVAGTPPSSPRAWRDELAADFARASDRFEPADGRAVEAWLAGPVPGEPEPHALCHNDLGDEHLMVDDQGRLAGVIDWTDAVVGDPARDLALIQFDLGLTVARGVVEAAGWEHDHDLWERARWFAIRAGVWGICRRLLSDGVGVAEQLPRLRSLLGAAR